MWISAPVKCFHQLLANAFPSWLYYKWWKGENAILADEMGLGKTIQIISFLSLLQQEHKVWPFLIVVPHSTVPNWKREIKLWSPGLRVVAYFGGKEARSLSVSSLEVDSIYCTTKYFGNAETIRNVPSRRQGSQVSYCHHFIYHSHRRREYPQTSPLGGSYRGRRAKAEE